MTIQDRFFDFQHTAVPDIVADFAAGHNTSPNLLTILDYLRRRWGGQCLGIAPNGRPVRGGSSPSTHTWGALDWRYEATTDGSPNVGRQTAFFDVVPFLIAWSKELGIQAIHDYVGCKIWRPPAYRGGGDGWKIQPKGSEDGQMGAAWAQWFHIEILPDSWFVNTTVESRTGQPDPGTPNPVPAEPLNPPVDPTPPPPPAAPPTQETITVQFTSRTLRKGDTGKDVAFLQKRLNQICGWDLATDGQFGGITEGKVVDFQAFFKIAGGADGIAGENTQRAMVELGLVTGN